MRDDPIATPFAGVAQQRMAATLGMWVFLGSELLFFGGLILGYAVYRHSYPEGFLAAARHTDILIGVVNTALLLTSSAAMALGAHAGSENRRRTAGTWIAAAALLGIGFLTLKGIEYAKEASESLVPGVSFHFPDQAHAGPAELFFLFYFVMTGVHAVHLAAGIAAAGLIALRFLRAPPPRQNTTAGLALYWHFVDLVWIFLFALLYLGGRA